MKAFSQVGKILAIAGKIHKLFKAVLRVQSLRTYLGLLWPELVFPHLLIGQVSTAPIVPSFWSGDATYNKSLTNLGNMMTTHNNLTFLYL